MTSQFSFLHDNLKVTPLDGDQVKVTLVLPSDLVYLFLCFLDSLTVIVQTVNSKSRLARYQAAAALTDDSLRKRPQSIKPYSPDPHLFQELDDLIAVSWVWSQNQIEDRSPSAGL